MSETGAVFYDGPSLLTGDRIVGIATGLDGGSMNPKTGPMVQCWMLRADTRPMDAKRLNLDDAVCGDCKLRGHDGVDSGCYVSPWLGPNNVFRRFRAGEYHMATWPETQALFEGRHVRLGAYGDPAAIPFDVWRMLLASVAGHVAYTHQWKTCDPRLKTICMASVDTVDEFHLAHLAGWRTFRVRLSNDPLLISNKRLRARNQSVPLEFVCPASDEANHRTTCQKCQLCRGTSSPARSVAIIAHGKPSSLKAFGIRVPMFGRPTSSLKPTFSPSADPPLLRAKFYRSGEVPA